MNLCIAGTILSRAMSSERRALVFIKRLVLFSTIMPLIALNATAVEATSRSADETERRAIPPQHIVGIHKFIAVLPDMSVLDKDILLSKKREGLPGNACLVDYTLNRENDEKAAYISIDRETSLVHEYVRFWDDPTSAELKHDMRIPDTLAFEKSLPVLNYFGMPKDQRSYRASFGDSVDKEEEDDLFGAYWRFSRQSEFKGIPCRRRGITIIISAFSGVVKSVNYRPVIEPEETNGTISKERAIELARQYLEHSQDFSGMEVALPPDVTQKTEQVITEPESRFFEGPPPAGIDLLKTYYCWEIPYEVHREKPYPRTYTRVLWITMNNGKVIGVW